MPRLDLDQPGPPDPWAVQRFFWEGQNTGARYKIDWQACDATYEGPLIQVKRYPSSSGWREGPLFNGLWRIEIRIRLIRLNITPIIADLRRRGFLAPADVAVTPPSITSLPTSVTSPPTSPKPEPKSVREAEPESKSVQEAEPEPESKSVPEPEQESEPDRKLPKGRVKQWLYEEVKKKPPQPGDHTYVKGLHDRCPYEVTPKTLFNHMSALRVEYPGIFPEGLPDFPE
jgi:hypothetical protein